MENDDFNIDMQVDIIFRFINNKTQEFSSYNKDKIFFKNSSSCI